MERRKLGADGPVVSAVGLGCMEISDSYGPADFARHEDGQPLTSSRLMAAIDRSCHSV